MNMKTVTDSYSFPLWTVTTRKTFRGSIDNDEDDQAAAAHVVFTMQLLLRAMLEHNFGRGAADVWNATPVPVRQLTFDQLLATCVKRLKKELRSLGADSSTVLQEARALHRDVAPELNLYGS
jgi:hypothetical protein